MRKSIDILIINNVPSFYKINLYNELAKRCSIHVVFIALTNQVVINESFRDDINFSYELISDIQIERRNRFTSLLKLLGIVYHFRFKKIVYGGYDDIEQLITLFLTPKSKNCLQFESSIHETNLNGIRAKLKRIIFKRVSMALPSGKMQTDVFNFFDFKNEIIETKGVGIFNKSHVTIGNKPLDTANLKFLYIGRLIPKKNLELLISVFNRINKKLTIVGTGVLEDSLKEIAHSNISFMGFIPNDEIYKLYNSHDVFVLPSLAEPWGLVVEEAIFYGLPVLVSNVVGCQYEMVIEPNTGCIFTPTDENSLIAAIEKIESNIEFYSNNCKKFDFENRDTIQIDAYLKIIK